MRERVRLANFLLRALRKEVVRYNPGVQVISPDVRNKSWVVDAVGMAIVGAHLQTAPAIEACIFVKQAGLRSEEEAAKLLHVSPGTIAILKDLGRVASIQNIPSLLRGDARLPPRAN